MEKRHSKPFIVTAYFHIAPGSSVLSIEAVNLGLLIEIELLAEDLFRDFTPLTFTNNALKGGKAVHLDIASRLGVCIIQAVIGARLLIEI